ncbi:MAG: S9 family peptidase [Planctomycetota bacterium]|nr:S9 family peptidase [Planctomycetota bacterium]
MLNLLLAVAASAADPHPFSVHDMLAMRRVSEPEVSPDGKSVLFNVRDTDLEANRGRTDLWLASIDGASVRQLTSHPDNDSSGRWSSDGKSVLFLSSRGGSTQVWRLRLDGGEPEVVTNVPLDVEGFLPFPDGKRLLLVLDVVPDADGSKEIPGTVAHDAEKAKAKSKARIYESLLFRHWDTWEDAKRAHLFVWDAEGATRALMPGFQADAPTKPFGGVEEIAISPDGRDVVFTARVPGREQAWTNDTNLWHVPADGSAAPKALTAENRAVDTAPAFSPDGKQLAFLRMERPGYESDRQRVALFAWPPKSAPKVLTEAFDRSPGEIAWTRDGRSILASCDDLGQKSLVAIDASSGAVAKLVTTGSNDSGRSAGDRIVFLQDTLASPSEIWSCAKDGSDVRRVTNVNAERVAAAKTGEYEPFTFAGWNGETVHAWLVKPVGFDASKKWPVAFLIHGGPQGSFGNHFHYRWNPQAYAGAGFAAVMVDFHGSTGYGQAFTDSIRGDWGGKPYEDLMKGLDAALAKYSFLDGTRVAALGASYGGYMINWIAGQTDRFRTLVNHDGNLDERMAYFDTEELWFPEWEHGGTPWENADGYGKHNPIDHVGKWKTPMLVIHGGLDFRVVETQGMSTFTALQRRGIPSKFISFPDENHWVLKPANSILWHENVIEWITRWTK